MATMNTSFAGTVTAAAAAAVAAGESFCGGPKAYIAAVHARCAGLRMDLASFQRALVAAHRAGELELVRIDLGGSADAAMLAASEIVEGLATWHAVRAA